MTGLKIPEERIWTSTLATAEFLKSQRPHGTAFVLDSIADLVGRIADPFGDSG